MAKQSPDRALMVASWVGMVSRAGLGSRGPTGGRLSSMVAALSSLTGDGSDGDPPLCSRC